jgi:hypothetical protein
MIGGIFGASVLRAPPAVVAAGAAGVSAPAGGIRSVGAGDRKGKDQERCVFL